MSAASAGVMAGYSALMIAAASDAAHDLGADEGRGRGRGDPGEGVREHPADGDGRVGEAGGGGEPVRRADVGADRGRGGAGAAGPGQREDHQQQPERGDDLGQEMRSGGPVLARDAHRGQGEHQVGEHRPGGAPGHLGGEVGRGIPPGQPAERGIGERHDRVEVAAGDRAEHQDDREQPGRGHRRVLQQLQPGLARATGAARRCRTRSPPRPGTRCRGTRRSGGAAAGPVHWSRRHLDRER